MNGKRIPEGALVWASINRLQAQSVRRESGAGSKQNRLLTDRERFILAENGVKKMKILKNILNWFMLICGAKSELTDKAVSEKICDFSGQGRNEFGK